MILFEKDWKRYPNAIVDTSTKNETFIEYADLLRDMGVKHWYFPLSTLDPGLEGLNPYDPDLTQDQKIAMLYEADRNPWWYLRELVVDPKGGEAFEDKFFRANRANIASMWMICACLDYIQIQPRQTGKSFGADANMLWLMYFRYERQVMNLITKGSKTRASNVQRLKDIRDAWPGFISRNTSKDDNNTVSLSCNEKGNKLFTHVAQKSEKDAFNLGRGLTSPFLDLDETAYIEWIQKTLSAASGGTNNARMLAERTGIPYCTVMTTTAGNVNDRDGSFVHDLWQKAVTWDELFFDLDDRDHVVEVLKANSNDGKNKISIPRINLTMSHRQLGFTDEWLAEAIERSEGSAEDANKDYMNMWESASEDSLIDKELARIIQNHVMEPIKTDLSKDSYMFRWYEDYNPDQTYIMVVDTSDALGRDDIGINLLNTTTGGEAGTATINDTNLYRMAKWLGKFLVDYKSVTLIIERRYNAQNIIDFLLTYLPDHGEDPFKRMYNTIVQNKDSEQQKYNEIKDGNPNRPNHFYDSRKTTFGFSTGKGSRNYLFSTVLQNAVRSVPKLIRDKKLAGQLLGLRIVNGRVDHRNNEHDDLAISWLIGQWFLMHGRNMFHYGIDATRVMQPVEENLSDDEIVDKMMRRLEDKDFEFIQELTRRLEKTKEDALRKKLTNQIDYRRSRIKSRDEDKINNLDAVIQKGREDNKKRYVTESGAPKERTANALLEAYGSIY